MHCGDVALFSLPWVQSQIDGHQNVGCPDQTWFLLFWSSGVCILLPVISWSQVLSPFLAEQHLIDDDIATSTLHCPLLGGDLSFSVFINVPIFPRYDFYIHIYSFLLTCHYWLCQVFGFHQLLGGYIALPLNSVNNCVRGGVFLHGAE